MLTTKENFLECIHGGNPDRYVNQYEAVAPMISGNPICDRTLDADGRMVDEWGVTFQVAGQPGRMPVHDMEHRVITDIAHWKDQVTPPTGWNNPEVWAPLIEKANAVDRDKQFLCVFVLPGVFERMHHLCEISEALMAFYDEPEAVHELIDCITDVELQQAEAICTYLKPEALFHHDDWGTQQSTFMAPEMFEEFLLEPYKKIYGYYKDHGVKLIIHHSDSYGMTLVPYMIDMGIDIWQGALLETNDIPALVDQYGDKITVMGGIEDQVVDKPGFTQELVQATVDDALARVNRKTGFIPCLTQGLNMSIIPGVYDAVSEAIDVRSKLDFA